MSLPTALLHADPRTAALLDLVVAFVELGGPAFILHQHNNNNSNDPQFQVSLETYSSSSSKEAQQFWRRFDNVDTVFAIIKVIESLLTSSDTNSLLLLDNNNNNDDGADSTSQSLLSSGRVVTQRDLYYSFVELLPRRDQGIVNRAVESIARFCHVERHELGVYASTRGFVAGCIAFGSGKKNGDEYDDDDKNNNGNNDNSDDFKPLLDSNAMAIPGEFAALPIDPQHEERPTIQIRTVLSPRSRNPSNNSHVHSVRCILMVEKESVFQTLLAARIWDRFPLVLMTGRGFGDMATRVLLSRLAVWLRDGSGPNSRPVPVYGLADCNPAGARIMFVYRFGSSKNNNNNNNSKPREFEPHQQDGINNFDATAINENNTNTNIKNTPAPTAAVAACPSIRWLGAHPTDATLVEVNKRTAFTPRDAALAKGLIRDLAEKKKQLLVPAPDGGSNDNTNRNDEHLQQQQRQAASAAAAAESVQRWSDRVAAMKESGIRFDLEAIPDLPLFVLRKIVSGDAI